MKQSSLQQRVSKFTQFLKIALASGCISTKLLTKYLKKNFFHNKSFFEKIGISQTFYRELLSLIYSHITLENKILMKLTSYSFKSFLEQYFSM